MDEILFNSSDERRILDFRPLGIRDAVVLGRYSYAAAHKPLEVHSHGDRLEICYLESGRQTYVVDGKTFELTGGDVLVTLPNQMHGTGRSPEEKGVLYWVIVHVPGPRERFLSLPPDEGTSIIDQLLNLPQRKFPGGKPVERTLRRVFNAYDRMEDPLRTVSVRNLLIRFLLDVLEASQGTKRVSITSLIRDIQKFIGENLGQPLSVSDLAKQAGLSQSRFKARFKEEVGIPPVDYVTRAKIERAKALLLGGDKTVTNITMNLGFSTTQYFATVFKRYTGLTPTRFRNEFSRDHGE